MNSQLENTNSKVDFVLKNRFETFVFKISGLQKKSDSDLVDMTSYLGLKFPTHTTRSSAYWQNTYTHIHYRI